MNGQYEFKVSKLQLIALVYAAEKVELPDNPISNMARLLQTMVACTVDKSTGEYVDDLSFSIQLLLEPLEVLVEWMEAFMEYCNTHIIMPNGNQNDYLKPFEDFLGGL